MDCSVPGELVCARSKGGVQRRPPAVRRRCFDDLRVENERAPIGRGHQDVNGLAPLRRQKPQFR
eukprot:1928450-Lingulodinium_polyedra.AAC.1